MTHLNGQRSNAILETIIREVDDKYEGFDPASENQVIIDSRGQTYNKKPAGPSFFRSYRYFIINTSATVAYDGYICTVRHDGGITNILAEYTLKCQATDSNIFALTYNNNAKAANFPNDIIQEEIENYHKTHSIIGDFYNKKSLVESAIAGRLKEQGLTFLSINLKLEDHQQWLQSYKIDIKMFKALLQGNFPRVTLGIQATIAIIPGQELKFLNKKVAPEVMEDEILRIIRLHLSEHVSPEDLYHHLETRVRHEIEKKVNSYLGDMGRTARDFVLIIHKHGRLDALVIEATDYIQVRVMHSHQSYPLKYKCELVSDPNLHARVFLFPVELPEIEDIIQDQLKNTLAAEVGIEEFVDELNTLVSARLANTINARIEKFGRKVGFFQLETDDTKIPPLYLEITHEMVCHSKDGQKIEVNNILLLTRNYNGQKVFKAFDAEGLRKWGKAGLDRIINNFIITRTYNELVFDFQDTLVRTQMQEKAQEIGYSVNQLVTLPKFGKDTRPDRFKISYKDTNLNSKVDGISLAISIHIEGRIRDYSKVLDMIGPNESILENMEKTVDAKMRQFFNSVDPERFYLRFYNIDTSIGETITLESEIKKIIQETLVEEYGAEVREVIVNPLNTRLIIRFKQLQEGVFTCTFQDKTGFFKYIVTIAVLHVDPDGWSIFNARGYQPGKEDPNDTERKDIAKHIKDYVENGLNTELVPNIRNGKLTSNADFIEEVKKMLRDVTLEIREIFGLVIKIYPPVKMDPEGDINIRLLDEKIAKKNAELEMGKLMYETALKEKMERLQSLYKMRKDKEEQNYLSNSPEMKRINDEIAEIERGFTPDTGPLSLDSPF